MDKQLLRERIMLAANSPKAEEIIQKTLDGPPMELLLTDSRQRIAA